MSTNGSIGYKILSLGAGQTEENTLRIVQAKADYVDITSETTIYEGYWNGTNYDICRIDLCDTVITRTWDTGDWEDRAVLLPPCVTTTTTTAEVTTTTTTASVTTTTTTASATTTTTTVA